eukprot:TRINITY_DN14333_c0_g1_i1.p1 TRINITY_DN14333_c0_g1~~TRINITY_DN14333_c0_g1_i1.p1  ORF type:complete len:165 (-),score=23.15 TRINITY_DN14333_c0_g1_i1:105-599(-)
MPPSAAGPASSIPIEYRAPPLHEDRQQWPPYKKQQAAVQGAATPRNRSLRQKYLHADSSETLQERFMRLHLSAADAADAPLRDDFEKVHVQAESASLGSLVTDHPTSQSQLERSENKVPRPGFCRVTSQRSQRFSLVSAHLCEFKKRSRMQSATSSLQRAHLFH